MERWSNPHVKRPCAQARGDVRAHLSAEERRERRGKRCAGWSVPIAACRLASAPKAAQANRETSDEFVIFFNGRNVIQRCEHGYAEKTLAHLRCVWIVSASTSHACMQRTCTTWAGQATFWFPPFWASLNPPPSPTLPLFRPAILPPCHSSALISFLPTPFLPQVKSSN